MNTKEMIGLRIKHIRIKRNFTQEKLAEEINISSKYLSSIERGKENPTLNTLIKLAQSLNVGLADFFTIIEVEDPKKRKNLIRSLLNEANEEQLKLAYMILSVIMR